MMAPLPLPVNGQSDLPPPAVPTSLLLVCRVVPSPPLPPFRPPLLGSVRRLWRLAMRRVCAPSVPHRAEVPVKSLSRSSWQEGAVVFALVPEQAIRALAPVVLAFAGSAGSSNHQTG